MRNVVIAAVLGALALGISAAAAGPVASRAGRADRIVRAGAPAARAAARLSGPAAALSRLHLPAGAAMAPERHRHRAGPTLLVGARLGELRRLGRLSMSRVFAGFAASYFCPPLRSSRRPRRPLRVRSTRCRPRRPQRPPPPHAPAPLQPRHRPPRLRRPRHRHPRARCHPRLRPTQSRLRRRAKPRRRPQTPRSRRKNQSGATRVTATTAIRTGAPVLLRAPALLVAVLSAALSLLPPSAAVLLSVRRSRSTCSADSGR